MSIWDWALETYARPGVAEQALKLQDEHGQSVALLFWAVWAEARDPARLADAAALARAWEERAVVPVRTLRRSLKAPAPPVPDTVREGLREEVKAVELGTERMLLEMLAQIAGPASGGAFAFEALQAATAAWGEPAPDAELAELAARLR